jgi:transcriptional regulator with XRE-family HTH domain
MNHDEIRRRELSDFLRTRRARISPAEVGLPAARRRRTPGLRREEVAQLARMSVTWYTWLEQKRPIKVSGGMLDNLARVLRLDPIERQQLFRLALGQPVVDSTSQRETVSPRFQRMMDFNGGMPAFVIGRRWDVLAWNQVARAVYFDFEQVPTEERNLVWLMFTNSAMRSLTIDWPPRARDVLARFRTDYGRHVGDAYFLELVERLNAASPEFAEWWLRHDIKPLTEGKVQFQHPLAGCMLFEHMAFSVVDNPELRVLVLLPLAEANSINKMRKIIAAFGKSARPKLVGRTAAMS